MSLDPSSVAALSALAVGFAFAGLMASAFELFTRDRASFSLLETGGLRAVASVPVLVFCAPFIILRNTVRGRRFERRPMSFVMVATCIAGVWSLMSGTVILDGVDLILGG